ncbi:low molecular weight phosphotyrosine protein phosphatase [Ectothiorhodospiraceae bacterium WFHF3C12]|nr:low molecular weight phosphotyrosine protein phosphatase [Ectothiorhodospiraceae bacterium WFHF3C12]
MTDDRTELVRVLFVCMGNICRSPTAEGVFRHLARQEGLEARLDIDSAGTHGYHVGHPPDARAQSAAQTRGYDLSRIRARQVDMGDFELFDWVLAMDSANLSALRAQCPPRYADRVQRFLDFSRDYRGADVPDPYYGGSGGFERVLDMVEDGARGLIVALRESHGLR